MTITERSSPGLTVPLFLRNQQMFALQNASSFTKCKMRQFYYKTRQLLQNESILLQNVAVIIRYNFYHKMRRYTT